MVYSTKDVNVHTGVMQCQHQDEGREILFLEEKRKNTIIIKFSFTMFYRMDSVLTVHGIEHDEGTTF
jgi:hypothetical protein